MTFKTFDISTIEGLKAAERYKARLENRYDKVIVVGGSNESRAGSSR